MRKLIVLGFVGLLAQLVDGSLGMAYGVTSSTLLLATGIAPAAASAAVHFSEIGTSLVSGFSHHKLGNVDWKTVSILAMPGLRRRLRRRDVPRPASRPTRQAVGRRPAAGAGPLRDLPLPGPRRPPPHLQGPPRPGVPGPDGPGRRHARLDRRRRLGPRRHHDAALLGPPRAPQGRRLHRHLRVRRRRRRLAGLPDGAGQRGHPVVLRAGAARRWRDRRPDRRLAGQAPAGPGPRHRGRWPDRPHQHQDHRRGARGVARPGRCHRRCRSRVAWIAGIVWAVRMERKARALEQREGALAGV